jgi:hypothetical protein
MLITLAIILICITFSILIQPSELLAPYARFVYLSKLPNIIKKLITCPYCIAFWTTMGYVIYAKEIIIYPFVAFLVVYYWVKHVK